MRSRASWLILTLALATGVAAEDLELPVDLDVDPSAALVLDLERAIVEIAVDGEARPSLRARRTSEKAPGARLVVEDSGRTLHVRRRVEAPGERPLRLELVVGPEQAVELTGRDLELTLSAPPAEPEEASPEAEAGSAPTSGEDLESRFQGLAWQYRVRLATSTANLSGLTGLRLEAEASDVRLRETSGPASLSLEGGSLDSQDHRGGIRLTATAARTRFTRHRGVLLFDVTGGEIEILTGEGAYRGESEGGAVSLVDWTGRAELSGRSARFEIRDGRDPAEVAIAGTGLDVAVDRLEGGLSGELDGGRLTGGNLGGNLEIAARNEARVSLSDLRGASTKFLLTAGASVDLLDVDSELEADVTAGARLAVDGVRQIGAKVVDGEIVADDVDVVRLISVRNSRFDLDFTQLRRQPAMAQRGTSEGRLKLAQPCVVHIAGPAEVIDERVEVTGCDLVTEASPEEKRRRGQRGYPEGTTVLVTNVEKDSGRLEIDGVVVP